MPINHKKEKCDMNKEEVYMRRLARCSMKELHAMKELVASRRGQMRFAGMMLRCITAAMMLKAGLQPA